jgi:hypothetical protein
MTLYDKGKCNGSPTNSEKLPKSSKSKTKCASCTSHTLFGGSKRRQIDKFYKKQCNLVESFEQDSKQIQV